MGNENPQGIWLSRPPKTFQDAVSFRVFNVPGGRNIRILQDFGIPARHSNSVSRKKALSRSSHNYFFARIENSINLGIGPMWKKLKTKVENTILWDNPSFMAKKVALARAPATFFYSVSHMCFSGTSL